MRRTIFFLTLFLLVFVGSVSAQEIGSYEIPLSIAVSPMNADNACLAARYLDGVSVAPGDEFSFNDTVGMRTEDKGYASGYIASTSRNEKSIGGGVCMTASILHQAVKSAGLQVLERHNHCIQISYLPLGEDAAVQYGVQDFRFKNNLNVPVIIRTTIGDSLKIAITTEDKPIQVINNGQVLAFDTPPVIVQDSLLAPLDTMARCFNCRLDWDSASQTVLLTRNDLKINFTIGSTTAYVNNQGIQLPTSPRLINNRTLVPLRFIAQELGSQISWDPASQTANITAKPQIDNSVASQTTVAAFLYSQWAKITSRDSIPLFKQAV